MLRSAARRVLWVAKGMALFGGAAVTLALVLGLGSAALAGTGVGARLHLGKTDAVDAVSALAGTVSGPTLRLENGAEDRLAAALLELRVAHDGITPMRTDSTQTVADPSADSVDGRDAPSFAAGTGGKADDADRLDGKDSTAFVPTKTYTVQDRAEGAGGGSRERRLAECDPGDLALSGGGFSLDPVNADVLLSSFPTDLRPPSGLADAWRVEYQDNGFTNNIEIVALVNCADLPPLR